MGIIQTKSLHNFKSLFFLPINSNILMLQQELISSIFERNIVYWIKQDDIAVI